MLTFIILCIFVQLVLTVCLTERIEKLEDINRDRKAQEKIFGQVAKDLLK